MIRPAYTYTYRLTRRGPHGSPHRWRFLGFSGAHRVMVEDRDRLLALVAGLERMGMTTPHTPTRHDSNAKEMGR